MEQEQVVLLNSGGKDSRVVAHILEQRGEIVTSLFIDLEQQYLPESRNAAIRTHTKYCSGQFHEVSLRGLGRIKNQAGWLGLPWQPALTCMVGATWAQAHEFSYLASGLDFGSTADHFLEHFHAMLRASKLAWPLVLWLPICEDGGVDVFKYASEHDIDLSDCQTTDKS